MLCTCSFLRLLHFCVRESHGIFWCPECISCGLTECVASAPFLFSLALILHGAECGMALQLLWELGGLNPGLTAELTLMDFFLFGPVSGRKQLSRAALLYLETFHIVQVVLQASAPKESLTSYAHCTWFPCLVIPLTQTCEFSSTKTDQPPSYTITQLCAAPNLCVLLPNNLSQAKFVILNHHRLCLLHEFGSCMFWAMLPTFVLDISGWKSTVS